MLSEKKVRYISTNVYEEAKKRIKHIINTFDKIYVCFSGGKDSLVALHLTQEVYNEMGIKDKVNVIFRDEELIPDDVIEFVQEYYHSGKFNFLYFAVPLKSNKFILGKTYEYIQWDPARKWIREKPDFAITASEGEVFDQYSMDAFAVKGVKGKIAFINGIRADESIIRFSSCLSKKNENYINATQAHNVKLCKPIYDFTEKDIFKYLHDNNIKYCAIYDNQMWNGQNLRVSTPLHSESAKEFHKVRTVYPKFYQQLVDVFPEMVVQEKYWKELDRYGAIYQYPKTWQGIFQYIDDNLEDNMKTLAKQRVRQAIKSREERLKKGLGKENLGGYPILYVFKCIVNGQFKRRIQAHPNPTKAELEYENNI